MDINEKIAANLGLVYQQLNRFNLTMDQDAESYAYESLYKAIQTYDPSTGAAFSTYATCVISNTLRMHIRKSNKKRQLEVVSYDAHMSDDEDSDTFLNTVKQVEDTESIVLFNELSDAVAESFNSVYNTLTDTHKSVISMWYESNYRMTQKEIAMSLGLSQAMVSRVLSSFKYKLKLELEEYM